MTDIFLSYSREDQVTARRFAEALQREGFSVWWDQTLSAGSAYDKVTEHALKTAKAVVVLWSRHSVDSRWVRAEATIADRNGTLVPVMLEPCDRPVMFELTQTAELGHWTGERQDAAWQSFVRDLRPFVQRDEPAAGKSAQGASATMPAREAAARRRLPRSVIVATVVALLVVLVSGGVWMAIMAGKTETPAAARSAAATTTPKSIAVLPFADLSPAADQGYFADGMSEEILNSLARIPNLQVTGRTSSFFFKGKNEDMKVIGEKLGVQYLLEGSVRKNGDQLRITAQLVKAADGFHLWSQTYDRNMKDVFGVQEDIARSVADKLQIALGVGELGRLKGMTHDVQAYETWLEAVGLMRELTLDGYLGATRKLEEVVQRDPTFELAWAICYAAYLNAAAFAPPGSEVSRSSFARSQQILPEAIRKNPESRLLKVLQRSESAFAKGNWVEIAKLWPEMDAVQAQYNADAALGSTRDHADWDLAVDKGSSAIEALERARIRDPLDPAVLVYLAEAYANTGRIKDALAEQDRGLALVPSGLLAVNSVITAYATNDAALIEKNWKRALSVSSDAAPIDRIRSNRAATLAELRRQAAARPQVVPSSRIALWAAIFGDPKLALQALREDQDPGRRRITAMALWRPVMTDVRQLSEFKDLVREWGLVDYWREFGWGDHCKPVGDNDFECH